MELQRDLNLLVVQRKVFEITQTLRKNFEDSGLVGCYVISSGKHAPTFPRGVLSPTSESISPRHCYRDSRIIQ